MAVGDTYVFPGFLTPVLTQLSFRSHWLLFSHASAEVRGENTPERKVASTGDRTHNHQVMSPTHSPLSHPTGAYMKEALIVSSKLFPFYCNVFWNNERLEHNNWLNYMVFDIVCNSITVISRQPVQLTMLSWSSLNQFSAQYSFQATGCSPTKPLPKQHIAVREEWILSQWLSSILGKNIARAGDRTSDLLLSSQQRYRLSYGAR